MTIYRRTNAGTVLAHDANSLLPRKLRTLLIAIDGKTTISTYVNSLSSFGDVEALLDSLKASGLIEDTAISLNKVVGTEVSTEIKKQQSFFRQEILQQDIRHNQLAVNPKTSHVKQYADNSLPYIVSLMCDFVSSHFPEHSMEIILSLESLDTIAEVKANMSSYLSLIEPIGKDAHEHIAALHAAMSLNQ